MLFLGALLSSWLLTAAAPVEGMAVAAPVASDAIAPSAPWIAPEMAREWLERSGIPNPPVAAQVRVEGRVIMRIAPRPQQSRQFFLDDLNPPETEFVERNFGKCVSVAEIRGAADRGGRLMLFLSDRRVLIANLERSCSARDFYRGFSVEKNGDGMMCAGRDRLMSRAGAKCQLKGLREVVGVSSPR